MEQGHALVRQGGRGRPRLVDETMVAVTTGELSPVVAGIVYCNTIAFCRDVYELRRAREWTEALTRWCEQQPDMVAHKGLCLVHRAEIMTLGGAWRDALEEARRVAKQFTQGVLNERALGHAAYRQAEVTLRGGSTSEVAYGRQRFGRSRCQAGADEAAGKGARRRGDGRAWRAVPLRRAAFFRPTSRSWSRPARSPRRARHAPSSPRSPAGRAARR